MDGGLTMPTPFSKITDLCRSLEATRKRTEKSHLISEFLRILDAEEVAPAVLLVVGQVFPEFDSRSLEVGWSTMKRVLDKERQTTLLREPLTVRRVHSILTEIAEARGGSSRTLKERLLVGLISDAEPRDVEVLVRIIFGEMRIGVNEGLMLEALAKSSGAPLYLVRRALMLTGNLGEVALIAVTQGPQGLSGISPELFVPLKPMLAETADNVKGVLQEHGGETVFEYKFDGARVQIHKIGDEVRVYSRRLTDVTESVPDIVEQVRNRLPKTSMILEGEVIAMGRDNKPLPFQDLMRRFTRVNDVASTAKIIPLKLHLFDLLYLNGVLLIDQPYTVRWGLLLKITPPELLAEHFLTRSAEEAEQFLKAAMQAGHEGLMAKRLDSFYVPGARGRGWLKLKPSDTLDLVIIAADWGTGRRKGWLSNYHLVVRDGDEWRVVGKTFKGLTDEEFKWMTLRLQNLKINESENTVTVKPEIVVEVAYNEIQRSSKYKSGFALRFARIKRIRTDKGPADTDTLDRIREIYKKQFIFKDQF
ncbi:MAG: ATP-dependent DNA ligase [Candidatus Bathyarchaeota archaeon]|nr:ATP-dependent DNA ligase [Candidatus Bathyarchaeota archaeon]